MPLQKRFFIPLLILSVLYANQSFSQINDSISQKIKQAVTDRFPIARAFNIEYSQTSASDFSSKLHDNALPEGKLNSLHRLRASVNLNFIKKPKWMLGAIVNYNYYSTDVDYPSWTSGVIRHQKEDYHYHFTSLNFTYFSKLFNKRVIYSGSISVDGSQYHFERIRGMATATMILKPLQKLK